MKTNSLQLKAPIGNGAFSAFVFSVVGWALIQTWCVAVAAPIVFQALAALIGICLAALGRRRYRLHWPALPPEQQRSNRTRKILDAGCCLLLLITGSILGQLVLAGWMFQLFIFGLGMTFVPWSRFPFCRRNFLVSGILFGAGVAYLLIFSAVPADSVRLLVAAWTLWSVALCALLLHKY